MADALTGQFDDERASSIVNAISHSLADIDLAELASEQPPISEVQAPSLDLKAVQFSGIDQPVVCDMSQGRPRVLVPETHRRRIFDAIHRLSHPSCQTTLSWVSKTYVWPNIRRDILRWARECEECQTSKVGIHTKPPVIPIPVPAARFEHVHVNLVGPFPPDRGLRYLLTIIDRTTKWPEAIPITEATSEVVLQAFLDHWISRFGIPVTVMSDRGTQFTSEA